MSLSQETFMSAPAIKAIEVIETINETMETIDETIEIVDKQLCKLRAAKAKVKASFPKDQDDNVNLQIIMRERGFTPTLIESTVIVLKVMRGIVIPQGQEVSITHDFTMMYDSDKYVAQLSGLVPDLYKKHLEVKPTICNPNEIVKSTIVNRDTVNAQAINSGRIISQLVFFKRPNATSNETATTNAVNINMQVWECPQPRQNTWAEGRYKDKEHIYEVEFAMLENKEKELALAKTRVNRQPYKWHKTDAK